MKKYRIIHFGGHTFERTVECETYVLREGSLFFFASECDKEACYVVPLQNTIVQLLK